MKKNKLLPSFTMLELLFVIVIISILASIAIPNLLATKGDAEIVSVKQDLSIGVDAILAHHTLLGDVKDISKVVNFDKNKWTISQNTINKKNLAYLYKTDDNIECVRLQIINNTIEIMIVDFSRNTSDICSKIRKSFNHFENGQDKKIGKTIKNSSIPYIYHKVVSLSSTIKF